MAALCLSLSTTANDVVYSWGQSVHSGKESPCDVPNLFQLHGLMIPLHKKAVVSYLKCLLEKSNEPSVWGPAVYSPGFFLQIQHSALYKSPSKRGIQAAAPSSTPTGVEWRGRHGAREAALALRGPKGFGVGPTGQARAVCCCPIPPRFSKRIIAAGHRKA